MEVVATTYWGKAAKAADAGNAEELSRLADELDPNTLDKVLESERMQISADLLQRGIAFSKILSIVDRLKNI